MLEIKNLSKSYTGKEFAIEDINLSVPNGSIFAFIGPNGAGKTTTIKSCVGLIPFEKGEIYIDNISIKDYPNECKKITAYLPDNPELYENLTGIQFLNFVCDIYRIPRDNRMIDIEKYSDLYEIKSNLGDTISSYSHGMKQKLALISAFIRHPKLLVLDEPFVGLDPKAAFTTKELMKEMCTEGKSVFFSTHVLDVAEKLCDQVAIIKNGKIVTCGTMDDVKGDKSLEEVFLDIK